MPLKTLEKETFFYIAYRRKTSVDFLDFKNVIDTFIRADQRRDIIIDLTKNTMITESEINVLVHVIKKFEGTNRKLCIITSEKAKVKLLSTRLADVQGVMIFDTHLALIDTMGKGN